MRFEKLKSHVKQKSAAQAKHKLADHKLEEKDGSAHDVPGSCAGCYEKIRQYQSREASLVTAKK